MDKETISTIATQLCDFSIGVVSEAFESELGLKSGVMIIIWPTDEDIDSESERIRAHGLACNVTDIPLMTRVLKCALKRLEDKARN